MATDAGITLSVGNEKGFKAALSAVQAEVKALNAELKYTVSDLSGVDDAESNSAKQAEVLRRAMEATQKQIDLLSAKYTQQTNKLSELKRSLEETEKAYGSNSKEANAARLSVDRQTKAVYDLDAQLSKAKSGLSQYGKQLDEVEKNAKDANTVLGKLKKSLDVSGDGEEDGGGFLGGFAGGFIGSTISAVVSGVKDLVESTTEYRKIMSTLEVSSQNAGYSAEQTTETYRQLYGVLGDTQTAATATANLQAIGLEQDKLRQITDGAIGAWAKYGDSIPIDGLAEAINETIQVGTVTGSFADVLNWAGTSEDEFNQKLSEAGSAAERADLVLQELANQGLMQAAEGWRQNNQDIEQANLAQENMNQALAGLGEALSPLVTTVVNGISWLVGLVSDLVHGFIGMVENGNPLISVLAGVGTAVGVVTGAFVALKVSMAISSIIATLSTSFGKLFAVLSANPILVVVALVAGLVAAFITAYNTSEEFREKVDAAFSAIRTVVETVINVVVSTIRWFVDTAILAKDTVSGAFNSVKQTISDVFTAISDKVSEVWEEIKNIPSEIVGIGRNVVEGLWEGVNEKVNWIKEKFSGFVGILKGIFTSGFETNSPSKFTAQIGEWVAEGLAQGMQRDTSAIQAAEQLTGDVKDTLADLDNASVELEAPKTAFSGDDFLDGMLAETDSAYTVYMEEWQQKQADAQKLAGEIYKENLQDLKDQMLAQMNSYLFDFEDVGERLMEGVASGIDNGKSGVVNSIREALEQAVREARETLDIHSPSGVFEKIGGYMAQGLGLGWDNELIRLGNRVSSGLASLVPYAPAKDDTMLAAIEGMVNGMTTAQAWPGGEIRLVINLDGRTIAERIFDPLRDVERQRGVAIG